jgi:uncharacterized low-complexity protein
MTKKTLIAAAVGTAFAAGMSAAPLAAAAENPFALSGLSSGYQVADSHNGKMMDGKCGGMKAGEGKCGEGKCGMSMGDTNKDGKISKAEHDAMFAKKDANKDGFVDKSEMGKMMDGKCGEGKCGANKAKMKDGSCGAMK